MSLLRTTENDFAARRQHYELLRQAVRAYGFAPGTMLRTGSGYRVEGPAGPRFLKRLNYGPAEASFVYHALEHLRRRGFAAAPRLYLTADGLPFIVPDGHLYYLQDWHDLTPADLNDPSVLGCAVDLMASLHRAGEGFSPPADIADVRNEYGSWLDKCVGRLREIYAYAELAEDRKRESGFDARLARASLYFARQAEEAVRRLADLPLAEVARAERAVQALCHRDFTPRNLALDERSHLRLIDFDNAAGEVRLDDLAKLLRRAAYLDPARAAFIVERYGRAMGRPLSSEELALLSAYLLFPTEFWSVGNSRFRKDRVRERTLRRVMRDADAWATFAGALRGLDVPRGELTGRVAGGAAGGRPGSMRAELDGNVALPDGPQLPTVPFAAAGPGPIGPAAAGPAPLELVRFDRAATEVTTANEEVEPELKSPDHGAALPSDAAAQDEWPVETAGATGADCPPGEDDRPEDGLTEVWAGAELPAGAEPWNEPLPAQYDIPAQPQATPPAPCAAEPGGADVAAPGGADAAPSDAASAPPAEPADALEYREARRRLISGATTIVWGKWPAPKEKASGGGSPA